MMRDTGQMDRKTHWKRKAKRLGGLAVGTGVGAGVGRGALEFGREVDPHAREYAKSWGETAKEVVDPTLKRLESVGGGIAAGFVPGKGPKKWIRSLLSNKEAAPLSMNTLSMLGGGTVGLAGSALAQRKGRYHDQLMRDTGHMDAGTHQARKNRRTLGLLEGTAAGAGLGRGALEVGRSLDHHTKGYVKDWGQHAADSFVDPTASRAEDIASNIASQTAAKTTARAAKATGDAVKSIPTRLAEAWKSRRTKSAYVEHADYDSDFLMDDRIPLDVRKEHYLKALKGINSSSSPLTRERAIHTRQMGDRLLGGTLGATSGMLLGAAGGRALGKRYGMENLGATAGLLLGTAGGIAGGSRLGGRLGRKGRGARADKDVAYDTMERGRVTSLLNDPKAVESKMHQLISTHRREKAEEERAEAIREEIRKHEQRKEMVNTVGELFKPRPPQQAAPVSSPPSRSNRDHNLSKAEDLFKSPSRSDSSGSYSHWAKSKRPVGGHGFSEGYRRKNPDLDELLHLEHRERAQERKKKYPTSHAGQATSQKEWEDANKEIDDLMASKGLKHAFVLAAFQALAAEKQAAWRSSTTARHQQKSKDVWSTLSPPPSMSATMPKAKDVARKTFERLIGPRR
jgi:ribosomal protein L17